MTLISRHSLNNGVSDSDRSDIEDHSSHFFIGNYEHNLEILENLDSDSFRGEADDDQLMYTAKKKAAKGGNTFRPIYGAVVPTMELHKSSEFLRSPEEDDDSNADNQSQSQGSSMITRNIFKVFERDDRYTQVSREEIRRVRVMHRQFMSDASFSFNYNTLLVIASLIAGLGLGSDSTATIIASMLVSPVMGPVMGMAYGTTILDMRLFKRALVTELLSLLLCILMGALVSVCTIPFLEVPEDWPTNEMMSRAEVFNFFLGIPIAFASGLGVAVSVLDEQTSSLVGVAISASLLPPAVNAGMLWTTYFFCDEETRVTYHFGRDGFTSLALTIVNILMIIVSSMLMFRVKERMDIKNKRIFWTDLGLARKIYRNLAFYENETTESEGSGRRRRLGPRFSFFVTNGLFPKRSNDSADGQGNPPSANLQPTTPITRNKKFHVPQGSDDASLTQSLPPINIHRTLPTVEEERMSGYSSA